MTLITHILNVGKNPIVHRVTRGRLWRHAVRINRAVASPLVTTIDGFQIITDDLDSLSLCVYHEYEPLVREKMRSIIRPGDVVVDVGANIGYHTVLMASLGAEVIALEPHPGNFALLGKNLFMNDMPAYVYRVAASDEAGEVDLRISDTNDGGHSIECSPVGSSGRTVCITAIRLDQILPPGPIRLIKMDIEGHEAAAIRGLGDRLEDVEYIIYEHWHDRPSPDPSLYLDGWNIEIIAGDNYLARR